MGRLTIFNFLTMMPSATAEATRAQLIEWHLNQDEYKNKDNAFIFLTIKNNSGTDPINITREGSIKGSYDVTVLGVNRKDNFEYKVSDLIDKDTVINPGETKTIDNADKPREVKLKPLVSGNGKFDAALLLNGEEIGHFSGSINLEDGLHPKLKIIKSQ